MWGAALWLKDILACISVWRMFSTCYVLNWVVSVGSKYSNLGSALCLWIMYYLIERWVYIYQFLHYKIPGAVLGWNAYNFSSLNFKCYTLQTAELPDIVILFIHVFSSSFVFFLLLLFPLNPLKPEWDLFRQN